MKFRLISFIFFLMGFHTSAHTTIDRGESSGQITVDGMQRSFIVYVPESYSPNKKSPAILLFHGGGGTARSMLNISFGDDFKAISERDNVILIAPEGIEKSWNDGRQTKANKQGIDDVKFVRQLLHSLEAEYSIDTTRIYATGISNGGFMTSRLGCEMGDKLAAIAVVAATMGEEVPYSSCNPDFMLPVMYIHGSADPIIPINGAEKSLGAEGAFVSHQAVIDKWVKIDQCNPKPRVLQFPDRANDGTTITEEIYSGGKNGSEVISYIVNNGGHTWPGGKQYLPKFLVGRVSRNMNACEVIWDFFRKYKR